MSELLIGNPDVIGGGTSADWGHREHPLSSSLLLDSAPRVLEANITA